MRLFLIGGAVGFIIGAAATVFYFSLATLFEANAEFTTAQNQKRSSMTPENENAKARAAGA